MNGRPWTKPEVWRLLDYAGTCSQKEAARRLGRTLLSVQSYVRAHGIVWRGGFVSFEKIASEFGCSPTTVRRVAAVLSVRKRGKGTGRRYFLDDVEAERVRGVLARQLARRTAHRIAGRRGAARRNHGRRVA